MNATVLRRQWLFQDHPHHSANENENGEMSAVVTLQDRYLTLTLADIRSLCTWYDMQEHHRSPRTTRAAWTMARIATSLSIVEPSQSNYEDFNSTSPPPFQFTYIPAVLSSLHHPLALAASIWATQAEATPPSKRSAHRPRAPRQQNPSPHLQTPTLRSAMVSQPMKFVRR